jgi:hypothetical protein
MFDISGGAMSVTSERAVSDLVGFTLVFGIIITSVVAVWFGGVGALEQVRDEAQTTSNKQAMNGLANAMEAVAYDGVSRRQVTLPLNGAGLNTRQATFTVEFNPGGTDGFGSTKTRDIGVLLMRTNTETRYVAVGGSVFEAYETGALINRSPTIPCDTGNPAGETNIAQLRLFDYTEEINYATDSDAQMVLTPGPSTTETTDSKDEIAVDFSSTQYPDLWRTVFERNGWSTSGSTATCDGLDRIIVHVSTVELSIIR